MITTSSTHHSFPVFSLFFGFIGSALLGVLVGCSYLLSIPPKPLTAGDAKQPDTEATDTTLLTQFNNRVTYYREPSFRQGAQALAKKLYASATNQVEISAFELNAWSAAYLAPSSNNDSGTEEGKTPLISFIPDVPVFHIADRQLHIAYPAKIEAWGEKWDLLLLSSGDFNNEGASPDWNVQRLYVNSAPIPFKHSVYKLVKPRILKTISENEEAQKLQTAWKMVKSVTVGETTLALIRK